MTSPKPTKTSNYSILIKLTMRYYYNSLCFPIRSEKKCQNFSNCAMKTVESHYDFSNMLYRALEIHVFTTISIKNQADAKYDK